MAKSKRKDRLSGEYQKEISNIIQNKLKARSAKITGIVSVTDADVSSDLKNAKIYLSIYAKNEAAQNATFEAIKQNAGFIRHELAQVMQSRTVPMLTFVLDTSMAYGAHIDRLLMSIHKDEEEKNGEGDEE